VGRPAAGLPACQFAEWHPHCTSLIDVMTRERVEPRIDWAAMPREEWDFNSLTRCEYLDLTISVVKEDSDADWTQDWQCQDCGGTAYDWVHRDYMPSGLQPGSFTATVEEPEE
jgi:hypothetical protein